MMDPGYATFSLCTKQKLLDFGFEEEQLQDKSLINSMYNLVGTSICVDNFDTLPQGNDYMLVSLAK